MKRVILVICCVLLFVSGCQSQSVDSEKTEVKINLPNDSTVNGYRQDDYISPDYIPQNEVAISINTSAATEYCGNKNSKVFHKSSCSSVKNMKEDNKVYFSTKEEFTQNGYSACQKCNP